LEGKFAGVQHRYNVHTNVCEYQLRNPNLSLVTPIPPPRQRCNLKSLFIYVWRRKVSKKRLFLSGPYKNMCTVNTSKYEAKQNVVPSLQFGIFLQGILVAHEC